jgi:uncharacterized membrane protein
MDPLTTVLLLLFYFGTPFLIIYGTGKSSLMKKAGGVVIAYLIGLILGNIGLLPDTAGKLQELLVTITIPLALPLLLFSLQVSRWTRLAGRTGASMLLALFALTMMVALGHYLWHPHLADSWQVAGLVGVYTGGTPNLASIKTALSVDETTYLITHTYDIVLCAIYLVILITFGKVMLRRFLPRFVHPAEGQHVVEEIMSTDDYHGFFRKKSIVPLMAALGVAVLIFGIGGGLSELVHEKYAMLTAILSITTLGIIASLIPRINKIPRTFELGMYFILVFSLVVASMADISRFTIESRYLFYYVTLAVFGTLILHIIFSKIFRIDADTTMITSVAMVFSPPFVPMMAGALKNRHIILSGLSVGIIGYAIGNYLGVIVAMVLRNYL